MDVRINGEGTRIAQRLPEEALERGGRWLVAWIDPEALDLSLMLLTDEEVADWTPMVPELTTTAPAADVAQRPD